MHPRRAFCRTTLVRRQSRCGWLLVGLIVLVSAVILALAGITFFLTEHLTVTSLRQNQTKAIYLAQAGIMQAIYDFRRGTGITLRSYKVDDPTTTPGANDDQFILQPILSGNTQADLLLMSTRGNITVPFPQSNFCGAISRDRFQGWTVRNVQASGGTSLVVASFKVNWDVGTEGILRLDLNGTSVDWQDATCAGFPKDTAISLASVPVANRTLNPGTRWPTNRVWFTSAAMDSKAWIDITFIMSDGFSKTVHWDSTNAANSTADLTVKSVGEVHAGFFPFVLWRRVSARYRVCATVSGSQCNATSEEETQPGALVAYQELTALTP